MLLELCIVNHEELDFVLQTRVLGTQARIFSLPGEVGECLVVVSGWSAMSVPWSPLETAPGNLTLTFRENLSADTRHIVKTVITMKLFDQSKDPGITMQSVHHYELNSYVELNNLCSKESAVYKLLHNNMQMPVKAEIYIPPFLCFLLNFSF